MTNTDRLLISLFIIVGIITVIVFFSRQIIVRPQTATVRNANYQVVAPARAGTVVRAISPIQTTRSTGNVVDSRSYYTYTTVQQPKTTTTYYESY